MFTDLSALEDFDKILKMEEGVEYLRHFREDDMPMKEGEMYSMVVYPLEDDLFGFQYAIPDDTLLAELKNKYGLSFTEMYLNVAGGIRELIE